MTWHHVAALLIAAMIVMACGRSSVCTANMGSVLQLATVIVAGVFGHAGASTSRLEPKREESPKS
jgi:hypothetical protein